MPFFDLCFFSLSRFLNYSFMNRFIVFNLLLTFAQNKPGVSSNYTSLLDQKLQLKRHLNED